ncbi:MAG: HipA domain-containing protein [Chthoniobacterales bacterium]
MNYDLQHAALSKRCLITYDEFTGEGDYSLAGLRQLHPQLACLKPLAYTAGEQRREALQRVGKLSLQGIQLKLGAYLNLERGTFELVDQGGDYILKIVHYDFDQLPENEDLTMKLASLVGIEVPTHGLIRGRDETLSYFIKRFDRVEKAKRPVEDFSQLSGASRETKYDSSMEKVVSVVQQYCTFPEVECSKLFERTLFNFLIGNEDMHLKNFSLLTVDNCVALSPAYDLINTTIVLDLATEEIALPIAGKKSRLTKKDLFDYLGSERMQLSQKALNEIEKRFLNALPLWREIIDKSFLTEKNKKVYALLLKERTTRLKLA